MPAHPIACRQGGVPEIQGAKGGSKQLKFRAVHQTVTRSIPYQPVDCQSEKTAGGMPVLSGGRRPPGFFWSPGYKVLYIKEEGICSHHTSKNDLRVFPSDAPGRREDNKEKSGKWSASGVGSDQGNHLITRLILSKAGRFLLLTCAFLWGKRQSRTSGA